MRPGDSNLAIYLNDHLAGATGGLALARRTRDSNRDTDLGAELELLANEIAKDREALVSIMGRLDVRKDHVKIGLGWAAEKGGRLKLNGKLFGYSPLSRLLELEGLWIGINGKLALWRALHKHAMLEPRLDSKLLAGLIAQAESQLDRVRVQHELAAEAVLR